MKLDEQISECLVSLFPEENYGNLDAAWTILEEYKLKVSDDDPEAQADLLDEYIRFYMLTGKLDEAYRCLEKFHALLDQLAPRRKLFYAVNKCMVDYFRRHPPILCFPVDLDGMRVLAPPAWVLDSVEIMQEMDRWLEICSDSELSAEKGACRIFKQIVHSQIALITARRRHPLFPAGLGTVDSKSPDEVLTELVPFLVQLQQLTADKPPDMMMLYVDRILLTLHYTMGSPACEEVSQRLSARYAAKGDKVGMANCKLLHADAMLSSPFTSPIILNMVPLRLPGATASSHPMWNEVEAQCPLEPREEAAQLYEEAFALYQESNAFRGQAAVLLRQGCLLHARARSIGPDNADWNGLLKDARRKLNDSLTLYGMDEANAQVVKTNQILLSCSQGCGLADAKSQAVEIGRWGRVHQNELLCRVLGSAIMQFARSEWRLYRRFQTALWAYECAECCLKALGDVVTSFAAIFDRAIMHKEVYNGPYALALAQNCVNMIDMAIQWYDEQLDLPINPAQDEYRRQLLELGRHDLISDFNHEIRLLYARFREQELLRTWERRYDVLVSHAAFQRPHMVLDRRLTPEQSKYSMLEIMRMDREDWNRLIDADIESHRFLTKGDVRGSEGVFEKFLASTKDQDITYSQPAYRIYACHSLGDVKQAKAILDSFSDQELLYQTRSVIPPALPPTSHVYNSRAHTTLYQCVVAQDWERADRFLDRFSRDWPTFWASFDRETSVELAVDLATVALIDLHNNRVNTAFRRLLDARRHIELGRNSIDDSDVKPGFMKTARVIGIYFTLAEICLLCSKKELPTGILNCYDFGHPAVTWEEHALLFVEEARARSTLDALKKVRLEDTSDERRVRMDSTYKHRAMIHLQSLRQRSPAQQKELERLQLETGPEKNHIDARPLHAAEQLVDPSELSCHLHEGDVVIEASFDVGGCILFAITSKGIEASYQSLIRGIDMRRWAMEVMRLLQPTPGASADELQKHRSDLDDYCSKIAEAIISPFASILRRKHHIIFSAGQPLSAFPFSLLPFDNKPLIHHAAVSQVPSLTVLYHLMQRKPPRVSPNLSVFAKSSGERRSSSDDPEIAVETKLHWAAVEALQVANLFSTWVRCSLRQSILESTVRTDEQQPIESSTLSREEFREHMRGSSSILHISTHGYMDREYPLLSWISLAEKFRVLDLSQVSSTANLIVFAACLSGLGYATPGSDILGFTHVILGTGCQAYLGGLINIDDFASMMLMIMFYRNLKRRPDLSLAECWRQAQLGFMEMDEQKATRFLDEMEGRWDEMRHHGDHADAFCPGGKDILVWQKKNKLSQIDWASPSLWAPFTLMGYGGLRFGP